jgi:hypothetical protein
VGTFTLLYNLDVIARVVDILDFLVPPLVGRPRSTAHASGIR